MKKILLYISIFVFVIASSYAQTLKIGSVTSKNYPAMKAEVTIKDATGKEIPRPYNLADIDLYEKGNKKPVTGIACSPSITKFSLIVMFDKTGSMAENPDGTNGKPPQKIDIAKPSAKALVNALPEFPVLRYETSLFIFPGKTANAGQPDIVKWWTTDKDSMNKEIDILVAGGKTDYNSAFLGYKVNNPNEKKMGVIEFASYSKYTPVIIFLTDGKESDQSPSDPIKTTEILKGLQAGGITCYVVGLGVDLTSSVFASFATSTGGELFNDLKDQDAIEEVYGKILNKLDAKGSLAPCEIEWQGDCDAGDLKVVYNKAANAKDSIQYSIDVTKKAELSATIRDIEIRDAKIGQSATNTVEVTAKNSDITFNAPGANFPDARFSVSDWGGSAPPFVLTKNSKRTITFQYKSDVNDCVKSTMTFNTSACTGNQFNLSAGILLVNDINAGSGKKNESVAFSSTTEVCNKSCNPITIIKVDHSGPNASEFNITSAQNKTLNPNECMTISGNFTPTEKGLRVATYDIYTSDGKKYSAALTGSGEGAASIDATDFTFDAINCGTKDSTITIKNPGALNLDITSMNLSNKTDFEIVNPADGKLTVPFNGSNTITIRFKPSTSGTLNSTLTLNSNAENFPSKVINLNGTRNALLFGTQSVNKLTFGQVCPNEKKKLTLKIENLGTSTFNGTINLTSNSDKFTISKSNWSFVNLSEIIDLDVEFSHGVDGFYTSTIELKDECSEKTIVVNLEAEVATPSLSGSSANFSAIVGSTDTKNFTWKNTSNRPFQITFSSSDPQYTIDSPTSPYNVPAGGNVDFKVTFKPVIGGNKNAQINISTTTCTYSTVVSLIGDPSFASATLEISKDLKAYVGQDIVIPIEIKNPKFIANSGASTIKASISYKASVLQASGSTPVGTTVGGVTTFSVDIPVNTTVYNLNFKALDGANVDTGTDLKFTIKPEANNKAIDINAIDGYFKLLPATAKVTIKPDSVFVGSTFNFPIQLSDTSDVLRNFHQGIKTQIRYNSTNLELLDRTSTNSPIAGYRVIDISKNINFNQANVKGNENQAGKLYDLDVLKFRALLGNSENAEIIIENVNSLAGQINVSSDSISIKILGLCKDINGNVRMFDPFVNAAAFTKISPNPSSKNIEIEVNIQEKGFHKIYLVNSNGNIQAIMADKYFEQGLVNFTIESDNLRSGKYFLIMDTPTTKISDELIITK